LQKFFFSNFSLLLDCFDIDLEENENFTIKALCKNYNIFLQGKKIRTSIGISFIQGRGLFALEDIEKNTVIGPYFGEVIQLL
jgi:hypothetical protein